MEVPWEEPNFKSPNCRLVLMFSGSISNFSPSCSPDGLYTPKQCFLERCWCADAHGHPIRKGEEWEVLAWSVGDHAPLNQAFFIYGARAVKMDCESLLEEYTKEYLNKLKANAS